MKQKLKKATYWASVITLGLVVGISLQLARANWTAPATTAPSGNVGAPINTGSGGQVKNGPLGVSGIFSAPTICLSGVCRSAWPGESSTTTYIQGGYYGRCVSSTSSATAELAAPMIKNGYVCECPAGFTKVTIGQYKTGPWSSQIENTAYACLKQ